MGLNGSPLLTENDYLCPDICCSYNMKAKVLFNIGLLMIFLSIGGYWILYNFPLQSLLAHCLFIEEKKTKEINRV